MEQSKQSGRNRLLVLVGVMISLIFLWLAFRGLQPAAFLESLAEVNVGLLLLAAATYFVAVLIIAWRWQFLLMTVRTIALGALARIVAIGYMGNNVYPLRAGEALRIFLLQRDHRVPVSAAATTVVVERVFDGIVMLTFLVLGLLAMDIQSPELQLVLTLGAPLFGVAVLVFIVLAAFPDVLGRVVRTISQWLPTALGDLLQTVSDGVLEGLTSLRSPLHLLGAVGASYGTWAVEAVVYWMVMWAFGLELGYPVALLVVGAVNLAGLIPASPGNVGVYEFFASLVLVAVGIGQDTALAYAIVVHVVIWLPITLVGFGALIQQGLGWADISKARELEAS